ERLSLAVGISFGRRIQIDGIGSEQSLWHTSPPMLGTPGAESQLRKNPKNRDSACARSIRSRANLSYLSFHRSASRALQHPWSVAPPVNYTPGPLTKRLRPQFFN